MFLAVPVVEGQKIADPLIGIPVRLLVRPSARTPSIGQNIDLRVTLLDSRGNPANATGDVTVDLLIRPPSGAPIPLSEKISKGKSSDTQSYKPRLSGRYVVEAVDRAKRLMSDTYYFYVFPSSRADGSLPPRWWEEVAENRWLAAKPQPPSTRPARQPKATLRVGYYGGQDGVLADGRDAVDISVIYDSPDGAAAPDDIQVWFSQTVGEFDKKPLVIQRGTREGVARWTSKEPNRSATIDYVAPKTRFDVELPSSNKFKFIRQVVKLVPTVPLSISIIDRPQLIVQFVDAEGFVVQADRKRTVTLSVARSGVTVEPSTHSIDEGGGPVKAGITPVSLGTATIKIDSDNLISGSTTVDISVGIGSLILFSLLGGLAGGGLAYLREKTKLELKLAGGVAGGLVLTAIYVFGAIPMVGPSAPSNLVAAVAIALIGGYVGTAVLDWVWAKLSKGS